MSRRNTGKPMKVHNFYCPEELWLEMQREVAKEDENDSEYIRNSILLRLSIPRTGRGTAPPDLPLCSSTFPIPVMPSRRAEVEELLNGKSNKLGNVLSKEPEYPKPSQMVKTFAKGSKESTGNNL